MLIFWSLENFVCFPKKGPSFVYFLGLAHIFIIQTTRLAHGCSEFKLGCDFEVQAQSPRSKIEKKIKSTTQLISWALRLKKVNKESKRMKMKQGKQQRKIRKKKERKDDRKGKKERKSMLLRPDFRKNSRAYLM